MRKTIGFIGSILLSVSMGWCGTAAVAAKATPAAATNQDDSMMMPFYTGKIFPTPQKAVYRNEFYPLARTGILTGNDIPKDDPRMRILVDRIEQYGGTASNVVSLSDPCDTFILVGDVEAGRTLTKGVEAPDKPEGYLIWCGRSKGKSVIVLKGHDRKGLLWAITSLNQMITRRDGATVAQAVEVFDYPTHAMRGFIGSGGQNPNAEEPGAPSMMKGVPYIVRFKMNGVFFNYDNMCWRRSKWEWRDERPNYVKEEIRRTGAALTPLGIEWYLTSMPLSHYRSAKEDISVQVRSKSEDDFNILFKQACLVEDAGGHFGIMYDDFRFPMHPDDVRDFGSAREADMYLLSKLDKALKAKYPKARMVFCPPFYWGPSGYSYGESGEKYLAAIGERLAPDLGIFWTGPRVKSGVVTKEEVKWITDLIKRKPLFFQNTKGTTHTHYFHYVTDPITAWPEWHYDGFFEDMEAYGLNAGMPGDSVAILTLVDFLWNPQAYDAGKSVEEAAKKLLGPESWPAMVDLNKKLSYFDQYDGNVSPAAARNLAEMEQQLKEVDQAWQNALAFHPGAVRRWTGMEWYITLQSNFVARVKKNPDLKIFTDAAGESRKQAQKEVALNPATDLFLAACDFAGGQGPREYGVHCEKRLATWIYGARSGYPEMRAKFEVDPFPPSGDYTLIVSGQDDDAPKACRIRIKVNDKAIFEGENGFATNGWSRLSFKVPGAALNRYSTLTIQNIEDTNVAGGPPFFMLNYAVLRKPAP